MTPRRLVFVILAALGASAIPTPADAYVRTTTRSGAALRWRGDCLGLVVHAGNPPPNLTPEVFLNAARAAAAAWSRPGVSCTELVLVVEGSDAAAANASHDRVNNVTFRRGRWCREPRDPSEPCYDASALAITTVTAQERDGVILDADIEVNAVNFTWDDIVARGSRGAQDIQNTLTHEFGHFIGLDHNCYGGGDQPRPRDHDGQPVPDCTTAPPEVKRATMYAAVIRGDTTRRMLSEDDLRAVCDIYPATGAGAACEPGAIPPPVAGPGDGGGCDCALSAGRRPAPLAVPLALLLGLAALRAWRRRG